MMHFNSTPEIHSFYQAPGWDFTGKNNSFEFIFLLMKEVNLYGLIERCSLLEQKILNRCSWVEII